MTAIIVAQNITPSRCPDCDGPLSMPLGSKARPGMVVQTCKAYETCGRSVWSAVGVPVVAPIDDDGSRHARFLLPVTSEPAPPAVVAPNRWTSMGRLAKRELAVLNQRDRKLAAAGGDR